MPVSTPLQVKIVPDKEAYHLLRNGMRYFIKGAGGDGSKTLLHALGGNSLRTWGADDLEAQLDEAQKIGLSVTAGIWLGHKEHGFDYHNAAQVAEQYEKARQTILRYRNHPALLIWALGNEMEVSEKLGDPAVWKAVNDIALLAKQLDPNHPTMTVIAEIGGDRIPSINRLCPAIDIIGINSYGGGPSLAQRYKQAGGVKPYIVTEFGPPGAWETEKTDWGAPLELSSTAKAAAYRKTYARSIASQNLCLGSYAFLWGNKQEATPTWFGMLLPDGSRLAAVEALSEIWKGEPPVNRAPELKSLRIEGLDRVKGKATVKASLDVTASENGPLKVEWVLHRESGSYADGQAAPAAYPEAILHGDTKEADVQLPSEEGIYRLFAYVHDSHGGAAVANVPILVTAHPTVTPAGKPVSLPFAVYDDASATETAFSPSGYMGNTKAIKMEANCRTAPHGGITCIQAQYQSGDGWGGVVWQSPANDWGNRPGGINLTGADKLTFWARGEKGGEKVSFLCGVIGRDKPYFDSTQARLDSVSLTPVWKKYSIDLKGKDLSCIKSGFGWVVAGQGTPLTFYLDDIRFE